jgi:alkylation response protein AidB-like acyl-CoA dehydrogenase
MAHVPGSMGGGPPVRIGVQVDFDDTPEEAAIRTSVRAWLERNADRRESGTVATRARWRDPSPEGQLAHVRACQEWQRTLFDGGWAGVTWPTEYGGRGGTAIEQAIVNQEMARFEVGGGALSVGVGMVGPTLLAWGTEEQKSRHLRAILRGDEVWCQLFSEPGAGSDLAGLRTRAELDGDTWVVNGQKVWTSLAHYSDWAILLARTDPDVAKHKGITYFLVDMTSPGIDVRPLRQIDGVAHFNEVFLADVRIPSTQVVGPVDGGWRVAHSTLQSERSLIGGGGGVRFEDLRALARATGRSTDPVHRQELARAYTRFELLRFLGLRVQTALSHGVPPGSESSVMKLSYSEHTASLADLALSLEGASGMLGAECAPDGGFWQQQFLSQWTVRIGGGTDQVQRNIIGERVLGLPREPDPTRDRPFRTPLDGMAS